MIEPGFLEVFSRLTGDLVVYCGLDVPNHMAPFGVFDANIIGTGFAVSKD